MQRKITKSLVLTVALLLPQPALAWWGLDNSPESTMDRLIAEEFYQIRGDHYFLISADEIVKTTAAPQGREQKYVIVVNGVIDKIINWDGYSEHEDIDGFGTVVRYPELGGVLYLDDNTVLRLAPISHGSIVSVQVSNTETETPSIESVAKSEVTAPVVISGTPVPRENAPVVVSQSVQTNNAISAEISVPTTNINPNSNVSVQVVADGRSVTSVGISVNESGTSVVTVRDLPQNENITIKTVVRDIASGTEQVSISTTSTISANIVTPPNARVVAEDILNVAPPTVTQNQMDSTGHRVLTIATPDIANLDSSKTLVSLMVINAKNSATHSVGLGGSAASLTVGSLSPSDNYFVRIAIRDIATGKETLIHGETVRGNK